MQQGLLSDILADSPSTPPQMMPHTVPGKYLQAKTKKEKLDQLSLSIFHPLQSLPSAVFY